LALTSVDLHKVAMLKGVKPWRDGEGPLGVAVACLETVMRNEGVKT
jgi:hypothetical protein